jgi:pyruvate-formate lyase-activating enzyme
MHLSRPEDYFSVYQSGCNHTCLKCHSAEFSKTTNGEWLSTTELALIAKDYRQEVTVWEPRDRATMWHAGTLCKHCGSCRLTGLQSPRCPQKLDPTQITSSVQGYGPARNIIAFTGGDLACQPDYYAEAAQTIKEAAGQNMWVLLETNGYALTTHNLDILKDGGIDAFWLDIKAYDPQIYKKLCGTSNKTVLESIQLSYDADFVLEILTLYIPGWVETDQHTAIAQLIAQTNPSIPTTLLAFFPTYQLSQARPPSLNEMIQSAHAMQEQGLTNLRLGNIGVFVKNQQDYETLKLQLDEIHIG